jgi:hypothetical protein
MLAIYHIIITLRKTLYIIRGIASCVPRLLLSTRVLTDPTHRPDLILVFFLHFFSVVALAKAPSSSPEFPPTAAPSRISRTTSSLD